MSSSRATALRVRRPRWKDPRLSIGILLVLVSVIAGALIAGRLAETTAVMAVRHSVVPGDVIRAEDLTSVDVRLGETAGLYIAAADEIPEGAVITQPLQAGELLAHSDVGQPDDVALRPIIVPVDSVVAESVAPGARVELWRTSIAPGGSPGEEKTAQAALLHEDAVVRRVDAESSLGLTRGSVEVLVPREAVGPILEAIAEDGRIDVVGVPGATGVEL